MASREIGRCPQCDTRIAENYRYSWCVKCTEPLPETVTKLLPFLDVRFKRPTSPDEGVGGVGISDLQRMISKLLVKDGVSLDLQQLINVLLVGGGAIICVAVVWWAYFYNQVMRGLTGGRGGLSEAFSCLYSSGGPCGFVSGMSQLGGLTPYNPVAFWIGAVLLGIGVVLRLAARPPT